MPSKTKNKKKQQRKSREQLKKDRHKLKAQNKHQNNDKKKKKKGNKWNEYSNLPHKELLFLLTKGFKELNLDTIQTLKRSKKNLSFKQQILAECFNFVWAKCNGNVCTEQLLSKKLSLLQILLKDFKLDFNSSQNFFSPKDEDTLYDRTSILCHKCLFPMIQFNLQYSYLSDSYLSSLKLLTLQQLHFSLWQYISHDGLGDDILCNRSDIIHASWEDIMKPKLNKWWFSGINFRTKILIPWAVSQGVYLDMVLPYFSIFKEFVMRKDVINDDFDESDPLKLLINEKECVNELGIFEFIYKQLYGSLGVMLLERYNLFEKEFNKIDVVYDMDLEYLYMRIADLFDEGRLKWLETEKGNEIYLSYVNIINECIDATYPLIGKIITAFLIGDVQTLDCIVFRNQEQEKWKGVGQTERFYNQEFLPCEM